MLFRSADHLIANGVTFQNRDIHWATEQAYKNGYADGAKKLAERLKEIYNHPRYDRPNAHTLIGKLFWNIDDIVKEMVGADNACD